MENEQQDQPGPSGSYAVDPLRWKAQLVIEKRHGDWTAGQVVRCRWLQRFPKLFRPLLRPLLRAAPEPDEVTVLDGNLATTAGANLIWNGLATGTIATPFNATNARIGVGDGNGSVPTPNVADTDLTATTNKLRKLVSGAPTVTNNTITFTASFGSTEANFVWNEWGIFNAASGATMLNHAGQSAGTKSSGNTWTPTAVLSL